MVAGRSTSAYVFAQGCYHRDGLLECRDGLLEILTADVDNAQLVKDARVVRCRKGWGARMLWLGVCCWVAGGLEAYMDE
jgi:hypothetical protein